MFLTQSQEGKKLKEEEREIIIKVANPGDFGLPISSYKETFSSPTKRNGIYVSHETIRRILQKEGIIFKKSKAWIKSPDYQQKKQMFLELKDS